VKGDITTHTGDIILQDKSIVGGDITIKRSHNRKRRHRTLDIKISDGSVVKGDIIVKDDDLKVKVFLSGGGKVEGTIANAEVVNQ
jgi:cytoskeletal protein CcmA (bactofilin family)